MVKCTFLNKKIKIQGRSTTCVLSFEIQLPVSPPSNVLRWVSEHPEVKELDQVSTFLLVKVQGRAVRAESDDDNPVIGARIAESRAKKKAYRLCATLCRMVAREYRKRTETLSEAYMNFETLRNVEHFYYNHLLDNL